MKSVSFTLATSRGAISITCNSFWYEYVHCLQAHPEEEPIRSALEHCLGSRIGDNTVPPKVMEGCQQIVDFFTARINPGQVFAARKAFVKKHGPKEAMRIEQEAFDNYKQVAMLHAMETTGPVQ